MSDREIYDPEFVRQLFDEMADTYGVVNLISSFGFARRWRRQCLRCLTFSNGAAVIDLMAGIGELCPNLAVLVGSSGRITTIDISPRMCAHAAKYSDHRLGCPVTVVEANILQCDLPDECADVVVSSFGLKTFNAAQLRTLARHVRRLLRPLGQFAFLEISVPPSPLLRVPYLFYVTRIIPLIGRAFLGNSDNYRLLGAYTKAFHDCTQAHLIFREAGLEVEARSFFFGCATAIYGRRPTGSAS